MLRRNYRQWALRALCITALGLTTLTVAACAKKDEAPGGARGPANVGFMVIATQPMELTQELSGRTSAFLVSDVRPQVGGIVSSRLFTEGGVVTRGQSLYQIDPATFQAALASAQASLQQAEAAQSAAQVRFDRAEQLIAIKAISQQDFDDAKTGLQQAQAAVAQSKAQVQSATINLNYTRVLAPISGRIGKSAVTPGALVTANQTTPLATIQDLSNIYVDITQSSSEVLRLKKAVSSGAVGAVDQAQVELKLDDGTTYPVTGKLQFSDVSVNPATGAVTLRAAFANPDGLLLPGMFVRARIVTGTVSDAILIPQTSVALDPKGGASVLIAGDDNKAKKTPITVAEMTGTTWRVTSGLKAGDKVIVEGALNVRDGADIKASPVKAAPGGEK